MTDRPQWEDCKVCGGDHWTKHHDEVLRTAINELPEVLDVALGYSVVRRSDVLALLGPAGDRVVIGPSHD